MIGERATVLLIGAMSLARVDELLDTAAGEDSRQDGERLDFRGGVVLEHVSFAYAQELVLTDIELRLAPGEHVALVGPNGAGKSTIVSLILGLYPPRAGSLSANGLGYRELDLRSLRRQIGAVLQDPVLFPGTIRENIAYGRADASDADVAAASAASTAADYVEALPRGYETVVGDEGLGLSGGLRQRVAIARALFGSPALLVLDEPTTYLDERSVRALMTRLRSLPQSPTVLLVTHDPAVAAHADRVIELRDGRIVDERTRDTAARALGLGTR
jgi:ATP-binding cassette subfamily B protein